MEINHKTALQSAGLFRDIGDDERENLINCLSPRIKHFSKNEILLLTGGVIRHIGIILCGTAHAYAEHIDGNRTIISNLTPTSIFGEILVSTRTHESPVTVCAASDGSVAFIEYQKIYSMCAKACTAHRVILQNMLKAIGDKYFLLFDRINILREKTLRARVTTYLYALSDRGKTSAVTLPFSKTMLAEHLLANRSALSKELRKMEDDGLIAVNGRVIELINL